MQTIALREAPSPGPGAEPLPKGEDWVDIGVDDDEGRRWLARESGLDDEIVRRLLEPAPITYWRRFHQGFLFNAYAMAATRDPGAAALVDFGIWLEPGRIVTVRRGQVPALESAADACAAGEGPSSSWGLIVFVLLQALNGLEDNLHHLTATIDRIEDEVLTGEGDPPLQRVAELQKRLIYARRFRVPVANLVSFISSQSGAGLHGTLREDFEAIQHALAQQQELLSLSIDRAAALQTQIRDQIANSMNAATYRFTWVATVFLPLSFITGLLGINVAGIPGDHDPVAFWLVCAALGAIAVAWGVIVSRLTRPFRRRRGSGGS